MARREGWPVAGPGEGVARLLRGPETASSSWSTSARAAPGHLHVIVIDGTALALTGETSRDDIDRAGRAQTAGGARWVLYDPITQPVPVDGERWLYTHRAGQPPILPRWLRQRPETNADS
jgi:hypothetical protein